jgi:putative cell wall-binding protein
MPRSFWRWPAVAVFAAGVGVAVPSGPAHAAITNQPGVPITRFAGLSRYDTAAQIATATFTNADTVVIASGASFADALSGNYLAGNVGGPILLTDPATLSPATAAALATLKARAVLLLGGQGAISDGVAAAIAGMKSTNAAGGNITVTRIAGASRYDTDKAVVETPPASFVGSVGGEKTALLASGTRFPDALAGGALAYGAALPILLTDPASLSPQAAAAITDLGIQQVVILGGEAAVSGSVESAVSALGVSTARLAGATRSETASDIADFAGIALNWGTPVFLQGQVIPVPTFVKLAVARGDDAGGGVDALALGPRAGRADEPILLTQTVDDPSVDVVEQVGLSSIHDPSTTRPLANIEIAGGTGAVSAANEALISAASGGGPQGIMTAAPTSVAAGGNVTLSSGDPCPPAPTGTSARADVEVVGSDGTAVLEQDVPVNIAGGGWSTQGAIPAATAPGQYLALADCELNFGGGDNTWYGYALMIGPFLTVT